jgi:LuxR family maltose regulon positive regulatory protein
MDKGIRVSDTASRHENATGLRVVEGAVPGAAGSALTAAKLTPPHPRSGTIPRGGLTGRLRRRPRAGVVLVVAPPGYGKSTLLSEIARSAGNRPFAWLTATAADNDPLLLARGLCAALERVGALDDPSVELVTQPGVTVETMLAAVTASLDRSGPMGLAIDDLQLLTSAESVAVVEELASRLPASSQLLLASRTPPPLQLTTLRAEGRVIDLGIDDLRLSTDEVAQLLREADARATEEEVVDLTERSEGWAAGVYLALLVHQTSGQPFGSFDGSDRFVREYFRVECLDELDPEDTRFLLRAAALDELSGPLCDDVLELSGSASRLERLAAANAFVVVSEQETRQAFRLHTLFREALRAELQRAEPGAAEALAARASGWCEQNDDAKGAIEYAWAAGDRDRFIALVERFGISLFHGGHLPAIERWLTRLDGRLVERHPAIAIYGVVAHALLGRVADAERWMELAAAAPDDTTMPDRTQSPLPWIALVRAAMCQSGVVEMRRDAEAALAGLAVNSPLRPTALLLLGVAQLLRGSAVEADETLGKAYAAATVAATPNTAALALAQRASIAADDGKWDAALVLATEAHDVLEQACLGDYPTTAIVDAARARSAIRRSDWVRARDDLARARAALPMLTQALPWLAVQTRLEMGRALLELSEREAAAAVLLEATEILSQAPELGVLTAQAAVLATELERAPGATTTRDDLTSAERRLLPLLMTHLTFREIGEFLNVSRNTVKTQAISTYRKLGVSSRGEAISRAIELGFVEKPEVLENSRSAIRPPWV